MGKGDKKSKKGKRWIGSYGKSRSRKAIKARIKRVSSTRKVTAVVSGEDTLKPKRAPKKKAEA